MQFSKLYAVFIVHFGALSVFFQVKESARARSYSLSYTLRRSFYFGCSSFGCSIFGCSILLLLLGSFWDWDTVLYSFYARLLSVFFQAAASDVKRGWHEHLAESAGQPVSSSLHPIRIDTTQFQRLERFL